MRKHSTWLWGIIIAAVAVSMVIVYQPTSGGSGEGRGQNLGTLFGQEITPEELANAQREVILRGFLQNLEWPKMSNDDLEREAYQRLFLIRKQESLGIHVSDEEVSKRAAVVIPNILASAKVPRDPSMSTTRMWEAILAQGRMTMEDFVRLLRHEICHQQLYTVIGLGGQFVTTNEARAMYERDNQEYHAEAAFFTASNFLSEVVVTPAALSEFYSNHVATYQIKERMQVSYVAFESTNHWTEAGADLARLTNQAVAAELTRKYGLAASFANLPDLKTLVDGQYRERTNMEALRPERPQVLTGLEPDKAKEIIRADIRQMFCLSMANKLAGEFANPLLSTEVKASALAEEAAKQGLKVKLSSPFDITAGPPEINKSADFARGAFGMTESEPIAGPIVGENAVFMVAMGKHIPAEIPPFESVKARVEEDFKLVKSITAARAAAAKFAMSVTNGMAAGKTFGALCAEAKGKVVLLPSFSMSTRSLPEIDEQMSLNEFLQMVSFTPVKSVSPSVPTARGSIVLHVQSRLPVDAKKADAELPEFLTMMRRARQQEAFQQWFNLEASRELGQLPIFRRQAELGSSRN